VLPTSHNINMIDFFWNYFNFSSLCAFFRRLSYFYRKKTHIGHIRRFLFFIFLFYFLCRYNSFNEISSNRTC